MHILGSKFHIGRAYFDQVLILHLGLLIHVLLNKQTCRKKQRPIRSQSELPKVCGSWENSADYATRLLGVYQTV